MLRVASRGCLANLGGFPRGRLLLGLCQNALYLGLTFIAMQWIEASLAAIIAALTWAV